MFVFLVALGIDYNIFLMTRVREEAQRTAPGSGALVGLAATGGVITSAGLVLAGTFAALAIAAAGRSRPSSGSRWPFGVLLDTIIVRSVLVTALTWTSVDGCGGPASCSRITTTPSCRQARRNPLS